MRDIFIVLIFPILVYFILKKPFIGSSLWIWSAMFYPKGWLWGFASSIRFNLIIALVTILAYVFQKHKFKNELSGLSVLVGIFLLWGTISSFLTLSVPEIVWHEWNLFVKIIIFYFICTITLKTKHHIYIFLWAIVLSAAFYGAGEGLKYIVSGGRHILKGISGSRLSDRNELALALNIVLPLLVFILSNTKHKLLKAGLTVAVVLNIVAIIGSFSRGGVLGLIVVAGYFFLKSKRKLLLVCLFSTVTLSATNFIPDKWFTRMETINEMGEDNSFLGRISAWKQATLMAVDNPIFGAGFKAGQNHVLWKMYEPEFDKLDFIVDTSHFESPFAKAAHSIYFQVLGDQGFVGLLIFLLIILISYRKLKRVVENSDDKWMVDLAKMLQISILVYCTGGAALSLPYFDLSFSLFALSHCLYEIMMRKKNTNVEAPKDLNERQNEIKGI